MTGQWLAAVCRAETRWPRLEVEKDAARTLNVVGLLRLRNGQICLPWRRSDSIFNRCSQRSLGSEIVEPMRVGIVARIKSLKGKNDGRTARATKGKMGSSKQPIVCSKVM